MWPVSRIANLIFVAVFTGRIIPLILLITVKFIFMQYQYIHCSTSLYIHTPSLKKYNFCHKQIYLSLVRKGLKCFSKKVLYSLAMSRFGTNIKASIAHLVKCLVLSHAVRQWHTSSGLEPYQCLQACGLKCLSHHAGCQVVSRYHTTGEFEESIAHRWWNIQARGSTLALKPKVDMTRSPKWGYHCLQEKTNVFQEF